MAKEKRAFIPIHYRPYVPGTRVHESSHVLYAWPTQPKEERVVLIIAAREDVVPTSFLNMIDSELPLYRLYYDELGSHWDFSFYRNVLTIHTAENSLKPHAIYHRHPGVGPDHRQYHKHSAFWEVIDQWGGVVLGQRRDHHHNSSKLYQIITSIKTAKALAQADCVRIPRSFFIKGKSILLKRCSKKKLIVKSCSGARSKVATQKDFKQWRLKNIQHIPTLFQEKITGKDVRVHICKDATWALMVKSKDYIDYRYASQGSVSYTEARLSKHLEDFCHLLARIECNTLLGIDFMKSGNRYFCLEANPGPGWSTFNHESRKKFAELILGALSTGIVDH